jgi:hypothetical protein
MTNHIFQNAIGLSLMLFRKPFFFFFREGTSVSENKNQRCSRTNIAPVFPAAGQKFSRHSDVNFFCGISK